MAFFISGVLAPISKGPEKLSISESGIESMGDAWLQFRIRYYMFALVFVVFDVERVLSMGNEFRCLRCICIYRNFHFRAYLNCRFSLCMAKGGIWMVLAPTYSDNKKKTNKKRRFKQL
uniref:NADH-plastoquinone oxidoreductase subunit 3 n=1 Tax=Pyrola atropurpurea TaxID=642525 RepID=UPI00315CD2E0